MTVAVDAPAIPVVERAFARWVQEFNEALCSGDPERIADHFVDDGYWRDILSFTWGFQTFTGRQEIVGGLTGTLAQVHPRAARVAADRQSAKLVSRSAKRVIEGYFDFDTSIGRGTGFVRLLFNDHEAEPETPKLWILLTTLQEIRGFEERIGDRRPTGNEYSMEFGGENWLDRRKKAQKYEDHEPEVLIIGSGQAGLCLAARLTQIGVDALIIERNDRVGDNWRNRYHSLTLHNEVWANSLPYLPFPPNWPTFVPKDKLAGWLEAYAEIMELNVWCGAEFIGGTYDGTARLWTARVKWSGMERELHAPHLVFAIGSVSGVPNIPSLPGIEDFEGDVIHSSQFSTATKYQGTRALVIGTGNSGHDVAQELFSDGAAEVTLMQRSPTCVVSLEPSGTMVYELYSTGPIEDIDLITASIPFPVLQDSYQWLTKRMCDLDRELLDRLNKVGFRTDIGEDKTGFHMKYLRQGGGYYINVGCSNLIADGNIGVVQAHDLETFVPSGVRFTDGSMLHADVVVLATGYKNVQEGIRRLLGEDVADTIGPVWGFNDQGFMKNMWSRTHQEHFWIMGGALNESRLYSKFLALQIKADLEGILPPGHNSGQLPHQSSSDGHHQLRSCPERPTQLA
jgi:cation diffusion facilitator CzcD-associated flavoprotein CzcO